jgi:nucleoside-diphosphate-sugar epimerase
MATERGTAGENYLRPSVEATFGEVIAIIAELLGKPAPRREIPMRMLKLFARVRTGVVAVTGREPNLTPEGVALIMNEPYIGSTKTERELGYTTVPLRAMFDDSYRWLTAEGLLG